MSATAQRRVAPATGTDDPGEPRSGRVSVVGSINIDTVLFLERLATPGETQIARDSQRHVGGKGLAQAIAASRFGARVTIIGATGADAQGALARAALRDAQVDISRVRSSPLPTGRAYVSVDRSAENSIVVVPGANADLVTLTDSDRVAIRNSDVLVTQFESGADIALEALAVAHAAGVTTLLNAAPAHHITPDAREFVDVLVVNAVEASQLARTTDPVAAASVLAESYRTVLVTRGDEGGQILRRGAQPLTVRAPRVEAVDTTGAGDVTCGVLAAALAAGHAIEEAVVFAFAAGALAVQTAGNAASIPSRSDVLALAGFPV